GAAILVGADETPLSYAAEAASRGLWLALQGCEVATGELSRAVPLPPDAVAVPAADRRRSRAPASARAGSQHAVRADEARPVRALTGPRGRYTRAHDRTPRRPRPDQALRHDHPVRAP